MIQGTGYIKREESMLFADVGTSPTKEWELIGDKVEDLKMALNPDVETVSDITGNTTTSVNGYTEQTDVTPLRAKKESKLATWLYSVVKDRKILSDCDKEFLAVNVFDSSTVGSDTVYAAWVQTGTVAVQSFGGNKSGLDMPFNIHWKGKRTYGTFNPVTKVFTPSTGSPQLVTFSVSGTSSARLAGAQIVITSGTTLYTDVNGIAYGYFPAGTYSYSCIATGYTNKPGTITVSTSPVYTAVAMTV